MNRQAVDSSLLLTRRNLHGSALGCALFAIFFVAGCATNPGAKTTIDALMWSGRISLQTDSDPPQAFFAGFELTGQPARGELSLLSPIGNVLGVVRWSPDGATLQMANDVKRYDSVEALLEQVTGAALPLDALFDWLSGKNTSLKGWTADLSRQAEGRIEATRSDPAPLTRLRVVLDR